MRRWNGWGDEGVGAALPPTAARLLDRLVGVGRPPVDASFELVVGAVPRSRLRADPRLDRDAAARVLHARGQSLPDWVALRSGRIGPVPDAVAHPVSVADVRAVLALAERRGAAVIPYGGGTSVTGGVDIPDGDRPVITLTTDRLTGLAVFDDESGLATFGAGTLGPAVEGALGLVGRTLGHFPQSFEGSTVGGWVVTRSAGQQSGAYGRIEALFAGGHLELPAGPLDLPPFPASAAGPDLRQLVLGSEGRAGDLTDVVVRTSRIPEVSRVDAFAVPGWEAAMELSRTLAVARLPLSMVRASTPLETATTFALAGGGSSTRLLQRYLDVRLSERERCLVLVGVDGPRAVAGATARSVAALARRHGAVGVPGVGAAWRRDRFRAPYLRNALWDAGYAVDTLETAVPWSAVSDLSATLGRTLRHGLEDVGERVHAFSHLSHVYPSGSSLYVTYVFRLAADPDDTLERWRRLKTAASDAIAAAGGTISHQHGVGRDHRPWIAAEKGELGMTALEGAFRAFDPDGIMSPGVLLPGGPASGRPA